MCQRKALKKVKNCHTVFWPDLNGHLLQVYFERMARTALRIQIFTFS